MPSCRASQAAQPAPWYNREPSAGTETEVLVRALALAGQVRSWSPDGDDWRAVTTLIDGVREHLTAADGILPSCPPKLKAGHVRTLLEQTEGALYAHAAAIGAAVGSWKHSTTAGRALGAAELRTYAKAPLLGPLRAGKGVKTTPRWVSLAVKVVDLQRGSHNLSLLH